MSQEQQIEETPSIRQLIMQRLQAEADSWNATHPVGSWIEFNSGSGKRRRRLVAKTSSEAVPGEYRKVVVSCHHVLAPIPIMYCRDAKEPEAAA